MGKKYVIAFDAGTTGCRTIIFNKAGDIVSEAYQEFRQIFPKPGWVEHNAQEIWSTQLATASKALDQAQIQLAEVAALGITNQRETTVIWDRQTGIPITNAIVWQDRRTAPICEELKSAGLESYVHENTGLLIDSYFSGTKIKWILDNVAGAREKARDGQLLFGTVDSWLIWKLTGGRLHIIDYTNASRTLLFNIKNVAWDDTLLKAMDIPACMLPQARSSSEIYGMTDPASFFGVEIPIAAAVGDQQSALFGQACFSSGMAKTTYGTGGSLLMNTGGTPIFSKSGLLTTIAWGYNGKVEYALEGLLFVVGAAVQWLRDEMKLITRSDETEYYASQVSDTNGVYFVPAFVGLSAPYWDPYARGGILGLTRGANKNHVIRATLESIAYQIKDVISCMEADSGITNNSLKVDGGACRNNFLMQFQADMLGVPVLRPKVTDTTARGAAYLAGLASGFWQSQAELTKSFELDRKFEPMIDEAARERLYAGWLRAVERVKDWEQH